MSAPPEQSRVVAVPLDTAILIRKVFLPSNPNKLRKAHPEVVQAVKDFIRIVESEPRNV